MINSSSGDPQHAAATDLPAESTRADIPALIATAVFTVAMNLIPLLGVFLWGWEAFDVIFLYWIETAVAVGAASLKVACALPRYEYERGKRVTYRQSAGNCSQSFTTSLMRPVDILITAPLVYGGGTVASGAIILAIFKKGWDLRPIATELLDLHSMLGAALVLIVVDQAIWTYKDFFRGPAWARSDPVFHLWRPMGRFVFLYFLLFFGGVLMSYFSTATSLLVWFIVLKMIGQIFAIPFTSAGPWQRTA